MVNASANLRDMTGDADSPPEGVPAPLERASGSDSARLAQVAAESFDFIWRLLRRLGVRPDAAVDDGVQRVFEIAARKAEQVPVGAERGFFFKTAVFVAAEERRRARVARERTDGEAAELASAEPDPETALIERRKRELLDEALDALPEDQRTVFVLYELEGLTNAEIGRLLGIPEGTATSRLRLGRERFHAAARRIRARLARRDP